MSKHLKQLEKELLEAQIKLKSIQLDIDQEVSRLAYEEQPALIAHVKLEDRTNETTTNTYSV